IQEYPGPERMDGGGENRCERDRPESAWSRPSAGQPGNGLRRREEAEKSKAEDEAAAEIGPQGHEQRQQPELAESVGVAAVQSVEEYCEEEEAELPRPDAEIRHAQNGCPENQGRGGDLVGAEMAQQPIEDAVGEGHDQRREQNGGAIAPKPGQVKHPELP